MTLSRLKSVAAIASIITCSACATVPTSKSEKLPWIGGSREVHRWTLPNGLKLVVLEDHSSPTFAWQTWYKVGSRDENPGRTGLAHLFEHMMFKGTKYRPDGDFDRLMDAAGAEGQNAFTSNDHTAYIQELPIESLELVAVLESERMRGLVVDDQVFSTEREVVQNERRMRTENSPDGTLYQELLGTAYVRQPYHWPVIGYEKDLAGMRAKDALEFYDRWYQPGQATVVVVGDVHPEDVLKLVSKKFGGFPAQPVPQRNSDRDPPGEKARRKILPLNLQVEKALIAWKVPEVLHPDTREILLLDAVLTAGKSSRLNRALVDTGVASGVYGYPTMNVDPSLYILGVTLQPGKRAVEAERIVEREIARLRAQGPTQAELDRARNQIDFQFYDGLNSNSEIANFIGEGETDLGGFEQALKIRNSLASLTPTDVRRAARAWLKPTEKTTVIGVPKKGARQ